MVRLKFFGNLRFQYGDACRNGAHFVFPEGNEQSRKVKQAVKTEFNDNGIFFVDRLRSYLSI